MSSALPHPAHGGAGHGATTARTLFRSGADTPRERPTGERYIIIRVRRREGENVLHRAASNDVDNFSVDNPLWITAAAGCRLLRGGRGRLCGGSVNADGGSVNAGAEVQTWTGRGRKASRAMGACRGRLSAPWLRFHGVDRADVYIIIRVCASYCGESALNPLTSQPIPRRRLPLAPAQRHARPEHFRSPTQPRCTPADCAMHSSPPSQHLPRRRPSPAPAQRHARPEHFHSPTQRHAASPSVPLRAQKNGTAQCMCDAECFGRPSLRSVIWVGEPRAVRRRCGALACRRGA